MNRRKLSGLEIMHLKRLCQKYGVSVDVIDRNLTYWENYHNILQHSTNYQIGNIEKLLRELAKFETKKQQKPKRKNSIAIPFIPPKSHRHPQKPWLTKAEYRLLEQLRLPLRKQNLPIYSFQ
jgi:hypothetical protein